MIRKSMQLLAAERQRYFRSGSKDIAETNLRTLKEASLAATLLTVFLVLLTPIIIPGWLPSRAHLILGPSTLVFTFLSIWYENKEKQSQRVVEVLCLLFIADIFLFVITMDVFQNKYMPSSFMPVILITVPALFIFHFRVIFLELGFFELIYIIAIFWYKIPEMAQIDCFNSIVGFSVSVVVAGIIQKLRAESYNAKNQYRQLSITDGLTGLTNKIYTEYAVMEHLEQHSEQENCALMILDVDDFKHINDYRGHAIGDEVLQAIGEIIKQFFPERAFTGRIGGDEFLIFLYQVRDYKQARARGEALLEEVNTLQKHFSFEITCSIGAAYLEQERINYRQLFQLADDTMYEAKEIGKARFSMRKWRPQEKVLGEKPLLLIADDNEMNRVILKIALQSAFEIIEAENGSEVIHQLGSYGKQLEMVLLDLIMPEIDGYQILKYMKTREQLAEIPVVVITSDNQSEREILLLGAADMIAKPFDTEVVQMRVKNAMKQNKESKTEEQAL